MALNAGQVSVQPVDPNGQGVTTNATPIVVGRFAVPPSTSILGEVWVIARRPDVGASKLWRLVIAASRSGSGAVLIEGSQNLAAMSAGSDATAMAGCAIATFSDSTDLAVQCTGPAGATVNWTVAIDGWMLTD